MNLYLGTSGYSYKPWKGKFYPAGLPDKEMLRFYGERFNSVEINNTFYRMPKPAVLESWCAEVPPEFRFVIKASQAITHFRRLKDAAEPVEYLLKVTNSLKSRLGALLFQTPANLAKDLPRLQAFLELIPPDRPAAFEFRHSSWFDDETFALLRAHNCALCLAEAEDGVEVPFVSTADWGYLRLRRADYDRAALQAWADRITAQDWKRSFIFFKHEDEALGPALAEKFRKLLN